MIKAIPYFGNNNNNIINYILESEELETKNIDIYNFIISNIEHNIVVIIDNKWLTWLNDIEFNYRDKKCTLAYWKFDTMLIDKNLIKNNKYQYLLTDSNNNYYVRYNYEYCEINIEPGVSITVFDVNTNKKYSVTFSSYIEEDEFNISKLYELYVNSCYLDDKLLNEHAKGYYYIDKFYKKLTNIELLLRKRLDIPTFKNFEHTEKYKDYRDVRNYKIEQVQHLYGLVYETEDYKIRRLRFESYLYCILRQQILSDNEEFNKEFIQLGKTKYIIKYGSNIKLIFKSYWLDNFNQIQHKSWMRANF